MQMITPTKRCKQCGCERPLTQFRPYKPRGTGQRQTTVGTYTICRTCEAFNARVNRMYRIPPLERTAEQQHTVGAAVNLYKDLIARGLEPIGPLARTCYPKVDTGSEDLVDEYMRHIDTAAHPVCDAASPQPSDAASSEDSVTAALRRLLAEEVNEATEMRLFELMEKCNDGNDDPTQKDLINQISIKIDEYDDQF